MTCARTQRRPGALARPNDVSPRRCRRRCRRRADVPLSFSFSPPLSFSLSLFLTLSLFLSRSFSLALRCYLDLGSGNDLSPRKPRAAVRKDSRAYTAPTVSAKRTRRHTPTDLYTLLSYGWPE